jgi:hypothetical protein
MSGGKRKRLGYWPRFSQLLNSLLRGDGCFTAAQSSVIASSRISVKIARGSTLRRHTWVPPTAVMVQTKIFRAKLAEKKKDLC